MTSKQGAGCRLQVLPNPQPTGLPAPCYGCATHGSTRVHMCTCVCMCVSIYRCALRFTVFHKTMKRWRPLGRDTAGSRVGPSTAAVRSSCGPCASLSVSPDVCAQPGQTQVPEIQKYPETVFQAVSCQNFLQSWRCVQVCLLSLPVHPGTAV